MHGAVGRCCAAVAVLLACATGRQPTKQGEYTLLDPASVASTPLNEWPMLMSHDAATGYLTDLANPVFAWARTQPASSSSFSQQLGCGARAFDLRGHVDSSNNVVFHHGGVEINHPSADAVAEIVAWANSHPALEDLVLIHSSDCTGKDCNEELDSVFSKAGVKVVQDCRAIVGSSLGEVAAMSQLKGGGHVLVLQDCVVDNFNESLTCSGIDKPSEASRGQSHAPSVAVPDCAQAGANGTFEESYACGLQLRQFLHHSTTEASLSSYYHCWSGDHDSDYPLSRLLDYLKQVASRPPVAGSLSQLQALWQETPKSVEIGIAHFSSLLKDEVKSGLNALMVDKISSGVFPHISLFEVNNVCDHGPDLLAALRAHHAKRTRTQQPHVAAANFSLMVV